MSRRLDRRQAQIEQKEYPEPRGRGVTQLIVLLAVAFVVTLGVVVGTRMSSDAIAVLVGVIAGVAASIPCALLLLAVTRRQQTNGQASYPEVSGPYRDRQSNYEQRPAPPPVIVVTSGHAVPQQIAPWSTAPGLVEGGGLNAYAYGGGPQFREQRQFRVMGYEESESQEDWEA